MACVRPTVPSRPCAPSRTAPIARLGPGTFLPCRMAPTAPGPSSPRHALWAMMCDREGAVPLEHDAYPELWLLQAARLPLGAEVLHLDEVQDANPVTLAILAAQDRMTVWILLP